MGDISFERHLDFHGHLGFYKLENLICQSSVDVEDSSLFLELNLSFKIFATYRYQI
jgi:hypothetical protein